MWNFDKDVLEKCPRRHSAKISIEILRGIFLGVNINYYRAKLLKIFRFQPYAYQPSEAHYKREGTHPSSTSSSLPAVDRDYAITNAIVCRNRWSVLHYKAHTTRPLNLGHTTGDTQKSATETRGIGTTVWTEHILNSRSPALAVCVFAKPESLSHAKAWAAFYGTKRFFSFLSFA